MTRMTAKYPTPARISSDERRDDHQDNSKNTDDNRNTDLYPKELSHGHRPVSGRSSGETMTCQLDLRSAQCAALFTSSLQGSHEPTTAEVRTAIAESIRRHGARGCLGRVAQEFGDHPDTAPARMRWANHTVADTFARPTRKHVVPHSTHSPSKRSRVRSASTASTPRA